MSTTDTEDREHLEAERDFLLRSLDDLESERAAGGIDDESYRTLRDDYTARAAAVIRALRDGVDARPMRQPVSMQHRLLVIGGVLALAILSAVALALALGDRRPGETSSGNTGNRPSNGTTLSERRQELERAVDEEPNNVGDRLLLARFLEVDDDVAGALEQYDAVIAIDAKNTQAYAHSGRLLYIAAQAAEPEQAAALVERSRERLDQAVSLDPEFADARFFRAIVLANEYGEFATAQSDLQRYLVLAPNGEFADQARALLEDVTRALESGTNTAP